METNVSVDECFVFVLNTNNILEPKNSFLELNSFIFKELFQKVSERHNHPLYKFRFSEKKKAEDMFEYDKDGNIRLKDGVKAIDLDNLTADDLRRMGIDPNLSKAEIARKLKVWLHEFELYI